MQQHTNLFHSVVKSKKANKYHFIFVKCLLLFHNERKEITLCVFYELAGLHKKYFISFLDKIINARKQLSYLYHK